MTSTDEVEKLLPERIFIHPGAEMETALCTCGKSVAYIPEQSAQPQSIESAECLGCAAAHGSRVIYNHLHTCKPIDSELLMALSKLREIAPKKKLHIDVGWSAASSSPYVHICEGTQAVVIGQSLTEVMDQVRQWVDKEKQ